MNAQNNACETNQLSDYELDAVSGGRVEVTKAEYEKILARMIADAKKTGPCTCPR